MIEQEKTKQKGIKNGINDFPFLSMPCFLYLFKPKSVRPPNSTANAVGP